MTCETSINVEAKRQKFLDQEWLLWRCVVTAVNVLYLDNEPFYTQNITWQYGDILWRGCASNRCGYARSPSDGNSAIEVWYNTQRFTTVDTINTFFGTKLNGIKFSVEDTYCRDNDGFFEVIVPLGQNQKNLETDNSLNLKQNAIDTQSQAIGDLTKAFHELIGKFASLERELDDVKQDFTDFRAAECKDRERECEELVGKIRAERGDGQNDSEL